MVFEEEKYNAEFMANPYTFGNDGAQVVGAHQTGFNNGVKWILDKLGIDEGFFVTEEKKVS